MIFTLALRNLLHDRVRLAVTLIGILFSIVLVAVQLGLYLGSSKMITANIAHSNADLFITTFGAKSCEDGGLIPWSLTEGTLEDIKAPDAIAVDSTYLGELGVNGIGDTAQVATGRVKIRA